MDQNDSGINRPDDNTQKAATPFDQNVQANQAGDQADASLNTQVGDQLGSSNDLVTLFSEATDVDGDLQIALTVSIPADVARSYGGYQFALAEALAKHSISLRESSSPATLYVRSDDRSFYPSGNQNFTIAWAWSRK